MNSIYSVNVSAISLATANSTHAALITFDSVGGGGFSPLQVL